MAGNYKIFTIDPGAVFMESLARGILQKCHNDPMALAGVQVFLPNRRAIRSLREAFLRLSAGKALLLPRMVAMGDMDDDQLDFYDVGSTDIDPAVDQKHRHLLLAKLILQFQDHSDQRVSTPAQALALAEELAGFLDVLQSEKVGFDDLAGLDVGAYASHWQEVVVFLQILSQHWPDILKERGFMDPAQRYDLLVQAQIQLWRQHPPTGLVIAAGSTGSIPASADLMKAILDLPHGMVVLPGLDVRAGDDLKPTHPQYGMMQLLRHFEKTKDDVELWDDEISLSRRTKLLQQMMADEFTRGDFDPKDLDQLCRIDCADVQEEARVVALIMRETLGTPEKTAALVTPDRRLARAVTQILQRWDIQVDDSAGVGLSTTPVGGFLRLIAHMMHEDVAPIAFLSCMKHPLCLAGAAPGKIRHWARQVEKEILRGVRPASGFEGLVRGLAHQPDLQKVMIDLQKGLQKFQDLVAQKNVNLKCLITAHIEAAEFLAAPHDLWQGEDGAQASVFLDRLLSVADDFGDLAGSDYAAFFDRLMGQEMVRPRYGVHPRLFIWGLLEARLQKEDVMILGSLNENTWPPEVETGPFVSRPMRDGLGLSQPEKRVGLTAHDFIQAAHGKQVFFTRAERVDGAPAVPSRWLTRLDGFMQFQKWDEKILHRGEQYVTWAGLMDAALFQPAPAPYPCPPVAARPTKLSVTKIERWLVNPYEIYARYILKLEKLKKVDDDPTGADYGILVHDILDQFMREYPDDLPDDGYEKLLNIGRDVFGAKNLSASFHVFWWPRFERVAQWVMEQERARRKMVKHIHSEAKGKTALADNFDVTARADRIDVFKDGTLGILDYKTGTVPGHAQVKKGLAPQLPLEAFMVQAGGFDGVMAGKVRDLRYWKLSGGRVAGEDRAVLDDEKAVAETVDDLVRNLRGFVARFFDPKTPYLAHPKPDHVLLFDDYEHLARVKEWSVTGGDE